MNNRLFVFKLKLKKDLAGKTKGSDVLFVYGATNDAGVESVKKLEKETGLAAAALMNNGGAHHIFLRKWYQAFPGMRIWITPTRVPQTTNGRQLREDFADRWELVDNTTVPHHCHQLLEYFGGDQVDCVLFDQIYGYPDKDSVEMGNWKDADSKPRPVPWSDFVTKMMPMMTRHVVHSDEPVFFHAPSKLIVTGHHFEFCYLPNGYAVPKELMPEDGGFFYNTVIPAMFFKAGRYDTTLASMIVRLYDAKVHAEQWREVMKWDFAHGCSHHDAPKACGPTPGENDGVAGGDDGGGGGVKGHIERVLTASGELTGVPDPGSWWPWRSANKLYKVLQAEAKFVKQYGDPPVLAKGGTGYDEVGMTKE